MNTYLEARWSGATLPPEFGRAVYGRTEGHPLFLVAVADHGMASGWLAREDDRWVVPAGLDAMERDVPANIRQMIAARLNRLAPPERRLAEAASVAGMTWSAASVAAALKEPLVAVDERCAALARRGMLLRADGETTWPDGTAAGQYGFSHALFREVIYDQVPAAPRRDFHRRVGLREEAAYGQQATQIAARLALHFEQAQDPEAAARYRLHASRNALAVSGYREVIAHATAGLALLPAVPAGAERNELELTLQLLLGMAAAAAHGFAAAEAERAYERAWKLSGGASSTQAAGALVGLYAYHLMRGRIARARGFAEQILDGAPSDSAAPRLLWGRMALGITQMHQGALLSARTMFEDALALYDVHQQSAYRLIHPLDLAMVCLVHLSWCLWATGYPTQAVRRSREAIAIADKSALPANRACAIAFASFLHAFRRDGRRARDTAATALRLSDEHGLMQWWAPSLITHGWGRAAQGDLTGGIREMRQGIEAWRGAGAQYAMPIYLALLADVLVRDAKLDEAREILAEVSQIAQTNGDRFWEPELHRLRGELLLETIARSASNPPQAMQAEAAEALERALGSARAQQARGLELRAALSLCRSAPHWGKGDDARARLAEIYGEFREGFETQDLREARTLL